MEFEDEMNVFRKNLEEEVDRENRVSDDEEKARKRLCYEKSNNSCYTQNSLWVINMGRIRIQG